MIDHTPHQLNEDQKMALQEDLRKANEMIGVLSNELNEGQNEALRVQKQAEALFALENKKLQQQIFALQNALDQLVAEQDEKLHKIKNDAITELQQRIAEQEALGLCADKALREQKEKFEAMENEFNKKNEILEAQFQEQLAANKKEAALALKVVENKAIDDREGFTQQLNNLIKQLDESRALMAQINQGKERELEQQRAELQACLGAQQREQEQFDATTKKFLEQITKQQEAQKQLEEQLRITQEESLKKDSALHTGNCVTTDLKKLIERGKREFQEEHEQNEQRVLGLRKAAKDAADAVSGAVKELQLVKNALEAKTERCGLLQKEVQDAKADWEKNLALHREIQHEGELELKRAQERAQEQERLREKAEQKSIENEKTLTIVREAFLSLTKEVERQKGALKEKNDIIDKNKAEHKSRLAQAKSDMQIQVEQAVERMQVKFADDLLKVEKKRIDIQSDFLSVTRSLAAERVSHDLDSNLCQALKQENVELKRRLQTYYSRFPLLQGSLTATR